MDSFSNIMITESGFLVLFPKNYEDNNVSLI